MSEVQQLAWATGWHNYVTTDNLLFLHKSTRICVFSSIEFFYIFYIFIRSARGGLIGDSEGQVAVKSHDE